MKKIIILVITYFVFLISMNIVIAEIDEHGQVYKPYDFNSIKQVTKGWNLLSRKILSNNKWYDSDSYTCKAEDFKIFFQYVPTYKKYYFGKFIEYEVNDKKLMIMQGSENSLENVFGKPPQSHIKMEEFEDYISQFDFSDSVWIYSNKNCQVSYFLEKNTISNNAFSNHYFNDFINGGPKLKKGWTFLSVTRGLMENSFENIKGNCTIEKLYLFDNINKKWKLIPLSKVFTDEELFEGLVIKVKEDCNLGLVESSNPPSLPE